MKFTKQQISDYVLGWLSASEETHEINDVIAAIKNASLMVDDHQDGIEAYVERMDSVNEAEKIKAATFKGELDTVKAKIESASKKGYFVCDGDGHLTPETLYKLRSQGFRAYNDKLAFSDFWVVQWGK